MAKKRPKSPAADLSLIGYSQHIIHLTFGLWPTLRHFPGASDLHVSALLDKCYAYRVKLTYDRGITYAG